MILIACEGETTHVGEVMFKKYKDSLFLIMRCARFIKHLLPHLMILNLSLERVCTKTKVNIFAPKNTYT